MGEQNVTQSAGTNLPDGQRSDDFQSGEGPGAAETVTSTSAGQHSDGFQSGEGPSEAETVTSTPAGQHSDDFQHGEGPGEAEAVTSTPVFTERIDLFLKKNKWFLIGLAVYMMILLAVSWFLQISLWRYLKNSQAEMDRQAAEQAAQQAYEKALHQAPQLAFEDWQSGLTADYWTDLWYAKAPSDLDARELVREFMAEHFASDAVEAYKAAGFTDETPVYVLKNGEDSLARITLTGSELNWSVSEVELLIEGTCSASVTVADSCHVYCNGREMGKEYAESAESRFHYELLEDRLEGAVAWVSYSVEGLLLEPELTVEAPEGFHAVRTKEGDYLLALVGDDSAYADRATAFVRSYLYYYMSGGYNTLNNMYGVLSHLTYGTKAYQDIQWTYEGVIWTTVYSDIDTSKTAAGSVLIWADNCLSVDVAYNADCTLAGQHVDYADATMRIYFLQTDKGYIISNFEVL